MAGVGIRVLQWAEGQVVTRSGEGRVAWPWVLVALAKQRVEGISLESVISDLASEVSRSGSVA